MRSRHESEAPLGFVPEQAKIRRGITDAEDAQRPRIVPARADAVADKTARHDAQVLGIIVQPLGVREPNDFDAAFAAMDRDPPNAVLMVTDSLTILNRKRGFEFVTAHHLPAIYEFDFLVRDGGLMSYGPDQDETFDRVAAFVDRILRGAKPAELPFEQPTRFRFVLNFTTAKTLGLTISRRLLVQVDEVIE